jgi:hypothetical protein
MQPSRGLAVACELLLLVGCASPTTSPSTTGPLAHRLREAVQVSSVRQDLASLERIADEHAGIRAAGTEGYLASASLVSGTVSLYR